MLPSKMMPDHLGVPVDHGAAGVAADDVGGADEVERRVELHPILALDPAPGQLEGLLIAVGLGVFVRAAEGGCPRNLLAFVGVTLHLAECESQREGRVGIDFFAMNGEAGLGESA